MNFNENHLCLYQIKVAKLLLFFLCFTCLHFGGWNYWYESFDVMLYAGIFTECYRLSLITQSADIECCVNIISIVLLQLISVMTEGTVDLFVQSVKISILTGL
jgi:hypothetical protein